MKRKLIIPIATICAVVTIFGVMAMAQPAESKSTILGFSSIAASLEKTADQYWRWN